jgi:hypothetical protein
MTTAFAVQEGYRPPQAEVPLLPVAELPEVIRESQPATPLEAEAASQAIIINETAEDELNCRRAERFVRTAEKAGALALSREAHAEKASEESERQPRFPSLAHAIHAAKGGDPVARQFVHANVRTEASEIVYKSGHVSEISIFIDENGEPYQYGQQMDDVWLNALRFASGSPAIRPRTLAEIRNGMRIKSARQAGHLKDHWLVIVSRYTDKLNDEEAAEHNFFPETKSCSIQAITEVDESELTQQNIFVAGVRQFGGERHDRETAAKMGDELGINLHGKDDAQTIDSAFLVPKTRVPSGAIEFAWLWDQAAGGTFFGEDKGADWADRPIEDYLLYAEQCKQRERDLEKLTQAATNELILNASRLDLANDPDVFVKATELLHDTVDARLIRRAIKEDRSIDARVFGPVAAASIEQGRQRYDQGDIQGAEEAAEKAIETSTSSSCPAAREKSDSSKGGKNDDTKKEEKSKGKGSAELCDIITSSCYCCGYNRDGTKRKSPLRVVAVIDQFETIYCRRDGCGAYMTKGGKIKEKGRIARRGERLARQQEKEEYIAAEPIVALEQVDDASEDNIVRFPARKIASYEANGNHEAVHQQIAA